MTDFFEDPPSTLGLHTFYAPTESSIEPTVDIIAVHGLGGDSYSTWQHPSGSLWLRDFLPGLDEAKNTRIMTFGYDARAFIRPFQKATTGRTFTFAEALLNDLSDRRITQRETARPIIFVGHSLGGIVIKSALIYAHMRSSQFGNILDSTKSLIFFGTPHQGSDVATWATLLGRLSTGLYIKSTDVTKELKTWSIPLVDLTRTFSEISPNFSITTFFEQRNTHGVLVVPEGSALLGQRNERVVGLDADHRQICRFGTTEDANYVRVLGRFRAIIVGIRDQYQIASSSPVVYAGRSSQAQDIDLAKRFDALAKFPMTEC